MYNSRTSHKECPLNKKRLNDAPTPPHKDDDASSLNSDRSDDNLLQVTVHLMKVVEFQPMTGDVKISLVATCVCGAYGRAHKRDCPMSSRSGPVFLQKCMVPIPDCQSDSVWGSVAKLKQFRQEEEPGC